MIQLAEQSHRKYISAKVKQKTFLSLISGVFGAVSDGTGGEDERFSLLIHAALREKLWEAKIKSFFIQQDESESKKPPKPRVAKTTQSTVTLCCLPSRGEEAGRLNERRQEPETRREGGVEGGKTRLVVEIISRADVMYSANSKTSEILLHK